MKKTICLALLLSAAGFVPAVNAQNHPLTPKAQEVTILNAGRQNGPDSTQVNVYEIFVENAPKTFNVKGAPRFALEGKDGKFYFGVGGTAKATLSYDWGSPVESAYDFTTSAIPATVRKGDGGLTQFSAATSNLFFNFVALPGQKNQIGAYINFNFTGNGNDYGFNLFYAYLKYRGLTVGYDFSLFSDMAAAPPSIDFEGPNSLTAIPNGVIDYRHQFNRHWSVAVGLEKPIASATVDKQCYMVSQRVPDIPAYVQYSWNDGGSWFRCSAILRNLQYHDIIADRNRDAVGWGVKVSGSAALTPCVTAYWQGAYGKGITSYFQDLYEGGLDMVPAGDGRLETVKAWGGYLGLQYNISPKVYVTTTYSHLRNYAPDYAGGDTGWGTQYRYAQYALANVIWNITPQISTGLEYIYGRRVDMGGLSRHDNRVQTMLQFSF